MTPLGVAGDALLLGGSIAVIAGGIGLLRMPDLYTCDGANISPPLSWEDSLKYGHYLLDEKGRLQADIEEIFRMAHDRGARDNVTVIVVRCMADEPAIAAPVSGEAA